MPYPPCAPGKSRNPATNRCRKTPTKKPCGPGKERNPATNRCRKTQKKPATNTLKVLPVDQEYNVYIICKDKASFAKHKETLGKYQGTKIHSFHFVKAVYLKDTARNRKRTEKLQTRHNTKMTSRLRKLGCILAHEKALKEIVKRKTEQNVILEADAVLDHVLPNPPKHDAYLGGWIVPSRVTLAGKQQVKIPNLKKGLNEIDYSKEGFQILMTHAYYMKHWEKAQEILDTIQQSAKVKNYDLHLSRNHLLSQFYYPALFVQSQHVSTIDGKTNKNDQRSKNYGLT